MSNTAGTSSKKTDLNIPKILETLKSKPYALTEDERVLLGTILQRYNRMLSARGIVDKYWQVAIQQFEAQYVPYSDGRSRSNVPLEWAIIELFVSEAGNRDSTEKLKAVGETDLKKVEVMRRVLDYCKTQYGLKAELYKNEYLTAIIGTGFYLTSYVNNTRVINDTTYLDDGTPQYTKKLLTENKIMIKALDPRYVYLDDRTNDFKDDNDQIYIDYITPEALQSLKFNKEYKNVESVSLGQKLDTVFWTVEERGKLNNEVIELMHYFNKASDRYIIIANRSCIIRDTPLPYSHKELPIVPRQYGYNPLSKYGRGLCEALLSFKSNINNLQEMIMDGIYRSNNSTFVIGNGLSFDGGKFAFNNTVISANGPVGPESFQEIRGQAPNQAIFSQSQDLLKQVAIYIGLDPTAIIGQPDSTAFEAGVRADTALKRVNVVLMNRDMALTDVYKRHLANIMQYFPLKIARGILEISGNSVDNSDKKYPSINLKDEKYVNGEFVQELGDFPFEISPEMIRGQYDLEVETNFNGPSVKTLRMARYKEFIQNLGEIAQVMQIPEITDKVKFSDLIDEMAYDMDIDLASLGGMEGGMKRQREELMQKVQTIAGMPPQGQMQPPPPGGGAVPPGQPGVGQPSLGAGDQGPDSQSRKKINGIMTPNIPQLSDVNSLMNK